MMFIELEFSNGKKVYVNPDHIRYITGDPDNEGMSDISIRGMTLHVKGDPKDIVHDIEIDDKLSRFGL